ncbi:MAG: lysophospholipid acyltransferase family protein [Acidimicrobiales bacterium]
MTDNPALEPARSDADSGATRSYVPASNGLPNRGQLILYRLIRGLVVAFGRVYWRVSVEGLEKIPTEGPFILAPVHRSNIDFAVVAGLTKRRMRYMGKDSIWKYQFLGRFFDALGAFPVHRGRVDREALRRCAEILTQGEPLVVFPEGTRQSGPLVTELFEGTAYLAAKMGVAVVPVGIGGSGAAMPKGAKLPRPTKVHMVVGDPLELPVVPDGARASRASLRRFSQELHARLQDLYDQAQISVGGGPD